MGVYFLFFSFPPRSYFQSDEFISIVLAGATFGCHPNPLYLRPLYHYLHHLHYLQLQLRWSLVSALETKTARTRKMRK